MGWQADWGLPGLLREFVQYLKGLRLEGLYRDKRFGKSHLDVSLLALYTEDAVGLPIGMNSLRRLVPLFTAT